MNAHPHTAPRNRPRTQALINAAMPLLKDSITVGELANAIRTSRQMARKIMVAYGDERRGR